MTSAGLLQSRSSGNKGSSSFLRLKKPRSRWIPSRASFNGVTNRWNSISSMADSTSLALRVLRFPFIAKLFALKKKAKPLQKLSEWMGTRDTKRWDGKIRIYLRLMGFVNTTQFIPSPYKGLREPCLTCFRICGNWRSALSTGAGNNYCVHEVGDEIPQSLPSASARLTRMWHTERRRWRRGRWRSGPPWRC